MTFVKELTSFQSGMTLAEMETALKRFGFDSTDPLSIWLNAAMHDVEDSFDWPWLESRVQDIVMPAGSSSLILPDSALKIIFIKDLTNQRKLEYYDRHKFAREISDPAEIGCPEVYTLVDTTSVQIWRVLQEEITYECLFQSATPDLIFPNDEPKTGDNRWPGNVSYLIVLRAAAFALQAENEEERAKNALEQYQNSLLKLMAKFGERELDEPTTVQDVQGYGMNIRRRAY